MTIKLITRGAPEDRRSVPLNPASLPTIKAGQVLRTSSGFAVLADGTAPVPDPMWAFTATGRLDTDIAKAVTVVESPFVADIGADGFSGSPVAGNPLKIGTGGSVGKLVVATLPADMENGLVVAWCITGPDANNNIRIKAVR